MINTYMLRMYIVDLKLLFLFDLDTLENHLIIDCHDSKMW